MVTSEKLTPERLAEIMVLSVVYDEDCPKFTKEQLAEFRPAHPENFVKEKDKKKVAIFFLSFYGNVYDKY